MSKNAKTPTSPNWLQLWDDTLAQIESVLQGTVPLDSVAKWATDSMTRLDVPARHAFLRVAWLSLAASPNWKPDDAQSELRNMAAVLRGESDFNLKYRYVPEEKLRRTLPASSFAPIDITAD